LLAVIGFPRTEDVAIRAARGVADDNHPISEHSEADDPRLAVFLARVFGLEIRRFEDRLRVIKVKLWCGKCPGSLRWIVGDGYTVNVFT